MTSHKWQATSDSGFCTEKINNFNYILWVFTSWRLFWTLSWRLLSALCWRLLSAPSAECSGDPRRLLAALSWRLLSALSGDCCLLYAKECYLLSLLDSCLLYLEIVVYSTTETVVCSILSVCRKAFLLLLHDEIISPVCLQMSSSPVAACWTCNLLSLYRWACLLSWHDELVSPVCL